MNLSVLIHTFNAYRHLWPGCIDAWGSIPETEAANFYFGTDITTDYNVSPFIPLYSGPGEWSDRLRALLAQIPTDYVLYMQEDHWPTQSPPDLAEMMRIMEEKQLLRLHLGPIASFYTLFQGENTIYFSPESKYLVSHQPSIWKKDFLLDCLKPGETPWVNEYKGTLRLQQNTLIREFIHKKIAIYPSEWYAHKCIKGKVVDG